MSPPLLVFDIDGTLLPHGAGAHPELLPALRELKEAGWPMLLATARRRGAALMRLGPIADVLADGVFNNGACLWFNACLHSAQALDTKDAADAYRLLAAYPDTDAVSVCLADERIAFSRLLAAAEQEQWGVAPGEVCAMDTALAEAPIRLCAWSFGRETLEGLYHTARRQYPSINWHLTDRGHCLFGTPAGVHKGSSVAEWCRQQGIVARSVIAFGDDVSDLELAQWAGTAVAVSDGHPALLRLATYHIPPAQAGGVAAFTRALLRGEPLDGFRPESAGGVEGAVSTAET